MKRVLFVLCILQIANLCYAKGIGENVTPPPNGSKDDTIVLSSQSYSTSAVRYFATECRNPTPYTVSVQHSVSYSDSVQLSAEGGIEIKIISVAAGYQQGQQITISSTFSANIDPQKGIRVFYSPAYTTLYYKWNKSGNSAGFAYILSGISWFPEVISRL
jgi:hypothetical protein